MVLKVASEGGSPAPPLLSHSVSQQLPPQVLLLRCAASAQVQNSGPTDHETITTEPKQTSPTLFGAFHYVVYVGFELVVMLLLVSTSRVLGLPSLILKLIISRFCYSNRKMTDTDGITFIVPPFQR